MNLIEALRLLLAGVRPITDIPDERAALAHLIANGWSPADAVEYIRGGSRRLH